MKILTYCSVFALFALLAFPLTADAFSRRVSHSEAGLTQIQSAPPDKTHRSTQSVPVPGTLLLFGGGFVAFAVWRQRSRRGKNELPPGV
jgi:PEP-CTERM motif